MKEYCVCGHEIASHKSRGWAMIGSFCLECCLTALKNNNFDTYEHTFKLDNLKFIEDLAKKRNLL